MKQVLHIFAKDARHQWLEILLSISSVTALVLTNHSRWQTGATFYETHGSLSLPQLLVFIVPLSWWLLISPAIHEERLVGDRQFWITRPYEWKKLIAAKVVFLVAFLYIPLLLAQLVMLAQAGFSPFSNLPGLLHNLLWLTCVLVLPLVALATVTGSFGRMTVAVLGALVCLVVIQLLASNASPDWKSIPHRDLIFTFLIIGICVAVIGVQYARRGAKVSWSLLGFLVVLYGAFSLGRAPDNAKMDRTYPPRGGAKAAAIFAYDQQEGFGPSSFVTKRENRVGISVPVQVTGVVDGTIVIPEFLKVTLKSPSGDRWTSVWQPASADMFFPGQRTASARFTMPRTQYDTLKGKPLTVEAVLALTQARAGNVRQIALPVHDFTVSGFGVCTPVAGIWGRPDEIDALVCRAPLRQPGLTFIHAKFYRDEPCTEQTGETNSGIQTSTWVGSLDRGPAGFGISPIWSSPLDFTNQFRNVGDRVRAFEPRKLCPGNPLTFTDYKLTTRSQVTLSINGFQLPDLNRGQLSVMDHDTQ
jgi:hypothetical protein